MSNPLHASLALGFALALGWTGFASAQDGDTGVNALCTAALSVGLASDFSTEGELFEEPRESRLQFFRFDGEPGTTLEARLNGQGSGTGTLLDPLLGLFDGACRLITLNDDDRSLDSRLRFEVPADGVFVIAAAAFPDFGFDGSVEGNAGTFVLEVGDPPPSIGSITARLYDPVFNVPVPGDREPYAYAVLFRCERDCDEYVTGLNADSEGVVRFAPDSTPEPLTAGTYLIRASALGYADNESGRFIVSVEQDYQNGNLPLFPPAFSIGAVEGCDALPPQGGTCTYRAQIRNATSGGFSGLAWSLVDSYALGSPSGRTSFEASIAGAEDQTGTTRAAVEVGSVSTTSVEFSFDVPSFLADGISFCQSLYVGVYPEPLYNTVARSDLFCVQKTPGGFSRLTGEAMAKVTSAIDKRSGEARMLGHGLSQSE